MKRDFQTELLKARPIASRIDADLTALGILHKEIDVERAGMLALVESPDGEHLGDMISLGDMSKDDLLQDVRHSLAKTLALAALGLERGNHMIYFSELIPLNTANWQCEISFDGDESRYAIIGEYIAPTAGTPLGWVRDYRIEQAKTDSQCDVPGCSSPWYERKVTDYGHCVHVCQKHQGERAVALYMRLHPVGGAQ